jgi:hypothetical protein
MPEIAAVPTKKRTKELILPSVGVKPTVAAHSLVLAGHNDRRLVYLALVHVL